MDMIFQGNGIVSLSTTIFGPWQAVRLMFSLHLQVNWLHLDLMQRMSKPCVTNLWTTSGNWL